MLYEHVMTLFILGNNEYMIIDLKWLLFKQDKNTNQNLTVKKLKLKVTILIKNKIMSKM